MVLLILGLTLVVSYLIGSVPVGYLFGRLVKGVDIRKHGSGNIGATNVFRVIGKQWGIIVLILDFAKGFLVVTLLAKFFFNLNLTPAVSLGIYKIIMAIAVISGHNWTIFLGFKGGKGIATSLGTLLGIVPLACGLAVIVWIGTILIWKYVSVASLAAFVSLPLLIAIFYQQEENFLLLVIFSIIVAFFAVYKHIPNIKRLLRGEEKRIVGV